MFGLFKRNKIHRLPYVFGKDLDLHTRVVSQRDLKVDNSLDVFLDVLQTYSDLFPALDESALELKSICRSKLQKLKDLYYTDED